METPPRRRDLLTTAALTALGVSGGMALWPFIAAMQPADDVRAQRTTFDTKTLTGIAPTIVNVDQMPVMIFRRTPEDLVGLRTANPKLRDADSVWMYALLQDHLGSQAAAIEAYNRFLTMARAIEPIERADIEARLARLKSTIP